MHVRVVWPFLTAVLTAGVAYGATPYLTLYRLGEAIQTSDTGTLRSLVNWPAVREGIKEDICDLGDDDPGASTGNTLPPFGASFVRGIASNAIDRAVTPEALLAATGSSPLTALSSERQAASGDQQGPDIQVNWAFFDSPTTFSISLQARGQAEPIRLQMDLRHGAWKVQRVWLPADLLANPGSRA
ncbi:DUF2939 domain-containing protein [Rhodopila globiformis]|nr:DUF2939 domain-containing protein [Rhodopila globiformis]